jgi:ATP-dependent protease HslVU (ClpYQ) peptidase subunit
MTCIVGIILDKEVFMGGDSCGSNYYTAGVQKNPKVFRKGELIMGYTTSFRMGQLLEFNLTVPVRPENISDLVYIVEHLIPAIRACLKAGGFAEVQNNKEEGGQFLIGYRGGLYEIQNDYSALQSSLDYAAVGSGQQVALGALWATAGQDPESRIKTALHAAVAHTPYVREPFTIIKLEEITALPPLSLAPPPPRKIKEGHNPKRLIKAINKNEERNLV